MNRWMVRAFVLLVPALPLHRSAAGQAAPPSSPFVTDSFFDRVRGFDGPVHAIVAAADGSGDMFVGGAFSLYTSTRAGRLVRLHADGKAYPVFSSGSGFDAAVNVIAPATDGSGDVYVGGAFTTYNGSASSGIIRLHADGSVNASFATGSGFNSPVNAIAVAKDGSNDVFVGGGFATYNGATAGRIVRLHADGGVNAAFVPPTFNNIVFTIAPAPEGGPDIYVGGSFSFSIGTIAVNRIIRLGATGARVATFVTGAGFNNAVRSVVPVPGGAGDIYVGGDFISYKGVANYRIIRLGSTGNVNSTLATGLGFSLGSISQGSVNEIVPAADGSGNIYVTGTFTRYNGKPVRPVARLRPSGILDSSTVASTSVGFDSPPSAVLPATDGSGDVFVGGGFVSYNGRGANAILRLRPDCSSISTALPIGGGFNAVNSGFLDTTMQVAVNAIAPAKDAPGAVYVGGNFASYDGAAVSRIIRLGPDGSADPAFGSGSGFDAAVNAIAPATDGSGAVYVGGHFTTYGGIAADIVRLRPDGTVDPAFVTGTGFDGWVSSLLPAADGSGDIYVGGTFGSYDVTLGNGIIRLHSDGSVAAAFSVRAGFFGPVAALALANDGSNDVYVGGDFSYYNGGAAPRIIRLQPDGSPAPGFAFGGGFDGPVSSIVPAGDGSHDIYVGGSFTHYDINGAGGVVRLRSDGSIVATFAIGTGFDGPVSTLAPAHDGSDGLYVGGDFTHYNGDEANRIVRLHADASIDSGFATNGGSPAQVIAVAATGDLYGHVFVGGTFVTFGSAIVDRLVRLHPDGSTNAPYLTLPGQFELDGTTAVPSGGSPVNGNGIMASAGVFDPDNNPLSLQIEVEETGVVFTGTPSASGSAVASGSMASVTAMLQFGKGYHWQVRAVSGTGKASTWIPFGTIPEDPNERDVSLDAPPTMSDASQVDPSSGSVIGVGGDVFGTALLIRVGVTPAAPTLLVRLEIELHPLGQDFTGTATSVGPMTPGAATANLLVPMAGLSCHWRYRAVDSLGLASSWTSFGGNPEAEADISIAPPQVTNVSQVDPASGRVLGVGGGVFGTTVMVRAGVAVADPAVTARLEVEFLPLGEDFSGSATSSSPTLSGHATAELIVPLSGTSFHWRYRAVDSRGLVTGWASYGGNPETEADVSIVPIGSSAAGCGQAAASTPDAGAWRWMGVRPAGLFGGRRRLHPIRTLQLVMRV